MSFHAGWQGIWSRKSQLSDTEERSSRSHCKKIHQGLCNWEEIGSPLSECEKRLRQGSQGRSEGGTFRGKERGSYSCGLTCRKVKHKTESSTSHSGIRHSLLVTSGKWLNLSEHANKDFGDIQTSAARAEPSRGAKDLMLCGQVEPQVTLRQMDLWAPSSCHMSSMPRFYQDAGEGDKSKTESLP